MTLHIIGPTKVINDMTVSALDLSDPDRFLADIKEGFIATGSNGGAEQMFCRRSNRLKRATAYIRYDFALTDVCDVFEPRPHWD